MSTKHPDIHLDCAANKLRLMIAAKRDRLVYRQRRGYDDGRQKLIDRLGEQYRQVYSIKLETEGN